MRKTNGRICGSLEDRINRFMRMLLEWQYDIRNLGKDYQHTASYYFRKYNVGNYKKCYFSNIANAVIDRDYAVRLMNKIGNDRIEYDKNLGKKV